MQERIKVAFSIPIVKFGLHLVLFAMIVGNIFLSYRSSYIQNRVSKDLRKLEAIQINDKLTSSNNDYYSSNEYRSKLYKEQGFKEPGEEVVSTSLSENSIPLNKLEFTPDENDSSNTSNLKSWLGCIVYGKNISNLSLNSKNKNIESWCK